MKVKIGQTKVSVFQTDERGNSTKIHSGIVIGINDSFVRVFNPEPFDKGGDVTPHAAQWYAINAPRTRCEVTGELKQKMPLPADI